MKMILLCLLAIVIVVSADEARGTTGRYCASGDYNSVTGSTNGYDSKHYCGVHMIDLRACVTITTPDNWTSMGCDNDDGFPSCDHNSNYCYWAGEKRICCCQSDYCNDCYAHNTNCDYPRTTTTRATMPTTTTSTTSTTYQPPIDFTDPQVPDVRTTTDHSSAVSFDGLSTKMVIAVLSIVGLVFY